jgi:hypothetical protein
MIKIILCLSYNYRNNPTRKNNLWNQINLIGVIMPMFTTMQTPLTDNIMSTWQCENCKVGGRRTWVALVIFEISHLLQWPWKHLTQHHARSSFPHMSATKNVNPHKVQKLATNAMWHPKDWEGWERPNLVCNIVEKTFEAWWKKKMIGQVDNQTPTLSPLQL